MDLKETEWDKVLKIKTSGRDDSRSDTFRYPYEPTPYWVLERLVREGLIGKKNTLIDYGCGKGRVDFFLSFQTKCHSIGVEYDERMYRKAMDNRRQGAGGGRCEFILENAENYQIPPEADILYFFNPFSVEILRTVMERIRESWYENPREIRLLFYYPSDEYVGYLMGVDELEFEDEIACMDLFDGNDDREKILIFSFGTIYEDNL